MTYYTLSQHLRTRFRRNRECILCGEPIANEDEMGFIRKKYGQYVHYDFYHKECLNNGKKIIEVNYTEEKA